MKHRVHRSTPRRTLAIVAFGVAMLVGLFVAPAAFADGAASSAPATLAPAPVLSVTLPKPMEGTIETANYTVRTGDERVPLQFTWSLNGAPIAGWSESYYYPTYADVGSHLSVSVASADPSYDSTPVVSNTVLVGIDQFGGPVSISGDPVVGSTVHADTTGWPPVTRSFKYEWFLTKPGPIDRIGITVLGRSSSFTIPASGAHHDLLLWVQGFAPGYKTFADVWFNSDPEPIVPGEFTELAAPAISGLAAVGSSLVASPGAATPTSHAAVHYQWFSFAPGDESLTPIARATSRTYVPTAAMFDRYLVVQVTYTRAYYDPLVDWSDPTIPTLSPAWYRVVYPPASRQPIFSSASP